ncbi:MAG: FAD-dependent oxidoreductase [Peptococcaceae bacterium]|nr:FAD-dependent oxidoreductase [Peptococcaceae bacterium]
MTLNRRDFIKKASLGAAVVAGSSFLIGCNNTEATAPAPAPETWDLETDVVVAGGGNGGLSAAAAAAESGKKVILCEISAFLGGGSAYSGGTIHSAGCDDWEEYRAHTEDLHDPVLAKKYVETFRQEYIPWLQNNGIPLTRHPGGKLWQSDWGMGSGEQGYLRHKAYFDALAAYAESKGTTIMTQTRVLRLVTDENGMVCGIQAIKKGESAPIFIKAGAVVLATGGFQSNKGLLAKYLGPNGDVARNMGVPYNTGSGMLMGLGVGAMTAGSFATFSGTFCGIVPGPFTEDDPEAYEKARAGDPASLPGISNGRPAVPMWINYLFPDETQGILVNLQGKRFVDETHPIDAKYARIPQEVMKQRRAMAFMIGDQTIHDNVAGSAALIKMYQEQGGKVVVGNTLEEFANKMQEVHGVYKGSLLKTINDYNKAIDNGTTDSLEVSRTLNHNKIVAAPFYAIPVTTCIYHTFGGLAINTNAQVLDLNREPIPNLYACPPCAAIFREVYCGGIGVAGTYGYIAGKHIASR